jgi:mycofactocin precursor
MSIDSIVSAPQDPAVDAVDSVAVAEAADVEELLVEEVSIDGMCGVY